MTDEKKCFECNRRMALKLGASVAVGLTTGAALPGCGDPELPEGAISVNLAENPTLMMDGGVVELASRDTGFRFSIFVFHDGEGEYRALSAECPHLSCSVWLEEGEFHCPCHDSRFDLQGTVLSGPSREDLLGLSTSVDGDLLIINPDM